MSDPLISSSRIRRRALAIAAAIGLMAMGGAALAEQGAAGTISGFVFDNDQKTKVVAIAADGTRYEVQVRRNGYYRITNVPPGTYELEFSHRGTTWIAEDDAVVKDEQEAVVNTTNPMPK